MTIGGCSFSEYQGYLCGTETFPLNRNILLEKECICGNRMSLQKQTIPGKLDVFAGTNCFWIKGGIFYYFISDGWWNKYKLLWLMWTLLLVFCKVSTFKYFHSKLLRNTVVQILYKKFLKKWEGSPSSDIYSHPYEQEYPYEQKFLRPHNLPQSRTGITLTINLNLTLTLKSGTGIWIEMWIWTGRNLHRTISRNLEQEYE